MINPSVCLCVCVGLFVREHISVEPLDRSSRIFSCRSPVAVARSSSGGMAMSYVLPVLWMTSRLAVMGGHSLMSMNALLLLFRPTVKNQQTENKKSTTNRSNG